MDTRLKWCGMLHRAKRTPGRFMMRLRTPNGIVNVGPHALLRRLGRAVRPRAWRRRHHDAPEYSAARRHPGGRGAIIDGLHNRNQTSIQSALDNVRNMVGSPLAGIDELEMVDTRPFCNALNDLITLDPKTGKRGNPTWGNLPRKFNVAVSGGRDDYAHTHINDIGLQPCKHATTGEMGFNVILGGYMSIKRVAESVADRHVDPGGGRPGDEPQLRDPHHLPRQRRARRPPEGAPDVAQSTARSRRWTSPRLRSAR